MNRPRSRLAEALERGRFLATLTAFGALDSLIETVRSGAAARIGLALLIGTIGAFIAHALHVPLAFMLGALFGTMIASLAGAPIEPPVRLRGVFLVAIGLFLSEGFSGVSGAAMLTWWPSILLALIYPIVVGALCYLFFVRGAGMTRPDALFSAIPGGLSGVVFVSGQFGADERRVALSHSLRVALVVLLTPTVFFGFLGYSEPALETDPAALISWGDLAILVAGSVVAIWIAHRARVPLPQLIAPLIVGAVLRLAGIVEGALPVELVEAALVVVGTSVGARFAGVELRSLGVLAAWTALGTLLMAVLSVLFAVVAGWTTGSDILPGFLAFAPGGVAEMTLVSIALETDPAYVASHHLARLGFILLATPFVAPMLMRWIGVSEEPWPAQSEERI